MLTKLKLLLTILVFVSLSSALPVPPTTAQPDFDRYQDIPQLIKLANNSLVLKRSDRMTTTTDAHTVKSPQGSCVKAPAEKQPATKAPAAKAPAVHTSQPAKPSTKAKVDDNLPKSAPVKTKPAKDPHPVDKPDEKLTTSQTADSNDDMKNIYEDIRAALGSLHA